MAELGRILAIDFGTKRLGIAVSDPERLIASPVGIINRSTNKHDFDELRHILDEYKPVMIAIGLPLDTMGAIGYQAISVIRWARKLAGQSTIPIVFVDESFSSHAATEIARSNNKGRRKQYIDHIAAATFLQECLIAFQAKNEPNQTLETFAHIA